MLRRLAILHFLNDGVRTSYVALLPFIAIDLSLNFTGVGFLGSSQGIVTSIVAFPAGFLMSRFGGFKILLISLFVYSVAAIGVGISREVLLLSILFYISSFGFGVFHTIGYTIVGRVSSNTNIGKNMGNFTAIGDIGRIFIPSIALFIAASIGWRPVFLMLGALGLTFFLLWKLLKNQEKNIIEEKSNEHYREWLGHLFIIIRQKKLLLLLFSAIIDNIAGNPVYIFLPFLLLSKGISPVFLSLFAGAYFLGSLLGKSVLGRGVDKFGNVKIFITAELFMATLLIALVFLSQFYLLIIVSFFLGFFTRGTTPVMSTLFSEVAHKKHLDKVYGVSEVFLGLAAGVAPAIMGIIADFSAVQTVFYVSAILAIAATIPIALLPKKEFAKDEIGLDKETSI